LKSEPIEEYQKGENYLSIDLTYFQGVYKYSYVQVLVRVVVRDNRVGPVGGLKFASGTSDQIFENFLLYLTLPRLATQLIDYQDQSISTQSCDEIYCCIGKALENGPR
jgi:hypothetical protein